MSALTVFENCGLEILEARGPSCRAFIAAVMIAIGIYLGKISAYVGGGVIIALVGGSAIAMVIRERAKAQKVRSRRG